MKLTASSTMRGGELALDFFLLLALRDGFFDYVLRERKDDALCDF